MNFNDNPDEAAFRAEARAWLEQNAPRKQAQAGDFARAELGPEEVQRSRQWQRRKAESGFACISYPAQFGGRGGTPMQEIIYDQEQAQFDVPMNIFSITHGMCIPTVMTVGDAATKERFVLPAMRGEHIWCQLFSEPAAGSDVAGLRTRAVKEGDDWIINGQKVWTSWAQYADYGLLLARTNPNVPKHKGLTMFWIDMKAPGVEVRPIHQMSGGSDFNEVYFTDLRIADSQRLGAEGAGWQVALVTLMNERLAIGGSAGPSYRDIAELMNGLATRSGQSVFRDQAFRERLADWYVAMAGLRYTRMRTLTALSRGQTPGPESSISKVVGANHAHELTSAALDLLDEYGVINDADLAPLHGTLQRYFMFAPALRIAGGTDEILLNIIAERVLGLPGDVRVDKNIAFSDLPKGR
jgi:alkylation response protein AidB-like acyl-CoA dehydrogenase